MKTTVPSTRRSFIQKAGAALSAPLAVAAATVPASAAPESPDPLAVRLGLLEDWHAIQAHAGEFAHAQGAVPVEFGLHDDVVFAPDGQTATARVHCIMSVEEPIGPDCPLLDMARQQGGGVVRRTERGVFEIDYVRRDGTWTLEHSAYCRT
jgi:SnoaL-like domain